MTILARFPSADLVTAIRMLRAGSLVKNIFRHITTDIIVETTSLAEDRAMPHGRSLVIIRSSFSMLTSSQWLL
jgi:hypothetical protein